MSELNAGFFYDRRDALTRASAMRIIDVVLEFLSPRSVVDLGCGVGTWLSVFVERGIADIQGIEGSPMPTELLRIPQANFLVGDLTQPLSLGRKFDLAISLEVAEHLPEAAGAQFVKSLIGLSDVVLFSAAIPGQGGCGHVNEQWPDYWRDQFAVHQYEPIDCIRWRVWNDPAVLIHYTQNVMMFARSAVIADNPALAARRDQTHPSQLSIVHPRIYLPKAMPSFRGAARQLPHLFWNACRRRFGARP